MVTVHKKLLTYSGDNNLHILLQSGLRQIDMQLMNQLWSLQQSIQDLKCMMSASDLSPQSAVDPWELNHQQNNEEFYHSPYRLGAVNEYDHVSSSTSSISSGSGEKPWFVFLIVSDVNNGASFAWMDD